MLWAAISVTEVIMLLLGGTTLMSFRGILVLTGVHAKTFPDLLIRDPPLSFYKQVKEKPSSSRFYSSSLSSCMHQTNLAIGKGGRILNSEESRTMVLKSYMFCILKQQSNAIFNVSCSYEKAIIPVNAFRFGKIQITWISKIYGKDKVI